jgi:hypothetical protein
LEGATMNSMSNVRGRKAPDETPHVLEGSGYRSRRRHGEGNKGYEDERLNTNS